MGRAGIKKGRLGGHLVLARKVQVHQKDRGLRSKKIHSAQHKKVPPSAQHKKVPPSLQKAYK